MHTHTHTLLCVFLQAWNIELVFKPWEASNWVSGPGTNMNSNKVKHYYIDLQRNRGKEYGRTYR